MRGVRFWAWQTLLRVERDQAYVNLALQQCLREARLEGADRRLLTELVYGTVQRQRTLDWLLHPFLRRPVADLDAEVRTVLRLTAYQLAFLDRIPVYAAVAEAVELCKRVKPKAAGFVNGVLRAYLRQEESAAARLARLEAESDVQRLGIQYSYPDWIVESFLRQFGPAKAERVLAAGNQAGTLSVRVNPLRADVDEVMEEIRRRAGIPVSRSPLSPQGLRLAQGVAVEAWDLYRAGKITIQDEAAMLVAPLLPVRPGARVLDLCAAPGAKTTHIAELLQDRGQVDACDLHAHKRQLIEQAAARLGLTSIRTLTVDGRLLPGVPGHADRYDAVLVDAPCSGLGVLRHRPDIRWRRSPGDVAELVRLQRQLLEAAAKLVRPGGFIVYSTCTVLAEENTDVVQSVVDDVRLRLRWDDVAPDLPSLLRSRSVDKGLLLTPDEFGTDGFYMARLHRFQ
ncbi:16S rRNA (cytosine(967)-C(5))-methyltransferase RsmB [Alicyclobacillus kakegawensis]|uniref:16S rRNA (cytosine(967)-C(5))-methyltransferase RsmB n=1 Tax=Alicyclobacillus kakegawensis TaxID=392012 RepID=UPI0008299288|nr:16S rRNA (cytosine(967)-C(5))-methyltransferase RsmB [Alicyclobacillus kakegawensis]